jgi:hypothetical protein
LASTEQILKTISRHFCLSINKNRCLIVENSSDAAAADAADFDKIVLVVLIAVRAVLASPREGAAAPAAQARHHPLRGGFVGADQTAAILPRQRGRGSGTDFKCGNRFCIWRQAAAREYPRSKMRVQTLRSDFVSLNIFHRSNSGFRKWVAPENHPSLLDVTRL